MSSLKVMFLFFIGLIFVQVVAPIKNTQFRVLKLDNCPEETVPWIIRNFSTEPLSTSYSLRFDLEVTEEISPTEDLKIIFKTTRCLDKSVPNTCEEYRSLTLTYFCKLVKIPGPWSTYLASLQPPINYCDFKKGYYRMPKGTASDISDIEKLRLPRGYYYIFKVQIQSMTSNKTYLCIKFEGQL